MSEINCFISYARTDEKYANDLTRDLQNLGIETWRDQENIPAGATWAAEVTQAIISSTHIILIATPNSVSSENVKDEVYFALDKGKIIIPLLFEDCELLFRVHRMQWIDFQTDYQAGIKALCEQLGVNYVAPEVYKPYLDSLFEDGLQRMECLSENSSHSFTSQQFLRDVSRDRSLTYIDFLAHVKEHLIRTKGADYANTWVFNLVHQAIGGRLSRDARSAGYEQIKGKRDEVDIFGHPANRVTYHRPR